MAREDFYTEIPYEEYKKYNIPVPNKKRTHTRLFKHKADDFLILYETHTFHDFEVYVEFIFPKCSFSYCAACNSYSYNPNKAERLYVRCQDQRIKVRQELFERYRQRLQRYVEQAEDKINLNNIKIT